MTHDEITEIGRLVMRLGTVERATLHPDGQTPETDTTHTVMLALLAMLLAPHEVAHLDVAKVGLLALVHDLPEAYAGDVVTARALTPEERAAKDEREERAIERIERETPTIGALIREYERRDTPEAVFVHLLDKAMPKLAHALNGCAPLAPGRLDMGLDELRMQHAQQRQRLMPGAVAKRLTLASLVYRSLSIQCEHAHPDYDGNEAPSAVPIATQSMLDR